MPITAVWTDPSEAGTFDVDTGAIVTEAYLEAIASNFLWAGGVGGKITQSGLSKGLNSNPTTTSATMVDLDGDGSGNLLRVDLNTGGGILLAIGVASVSNSGAGGINSLGISLDGAAAVDVVQQHTPVNAYSEMLVTLARFSGVSVASHYVKVQWATSAGTATASGIARYLLVLETHN